MRQTPGCVLEFDLGWVNQLSPCELVGNHVKGVAKQACPSESISLQEKLLALLVLLHLNFGIDAVKRRGNPYKQTQNAHCCYMVLSHATENFQ